MIDHLYGLVDMHNHILPGIDDGAKTVEDSINLIKGFSEFGVTNFVCTPHIMHNYYPNTPETIQNSFNLLEKELQQQGIDNVSIRAAAEHMIDDNFEEILETNNIMPIKGKYVLVETPFLAPPLNLERCLEKVKSKGFFPILAHPERYLFLHNKLEKYFHYKNQNTKLQMNLMSLCEFYGSKIADVSFKLLRKGTIDYIASDIHNSKQLVSLKEFKVSRKNLDYLMPIVERTIDTFY
ncbi:tyrosine-protein phosphatase [Flagellimonas eckloniae]|uniref:tyrosine-protein phosphatase n=1 Tax=Flagellimonas eckloniae TaxID=346185 RepID=UPI001FE0B0C4|nr:CpsB/CapC family capsule biosynthesis tyrosine phosphatase [Allomuricauda eckloniae]